MKTEDKFKPAKEPEYIQVVRQLVIPETPTGLIGEKVVYNDKFLRSINYEPIVPLPECGYFIITKATIDDRGNVMIAFHPCPSNYNNPDGTHINVCNMKKYAPPPCDCKFPQRRAEDSEKTSIGDFLLEMKKDISDKLRRALEYMYWCGKRYLEDVCEEKTFLSFRSVGMGTYREFLHVRDKYMDMKWKEAKCLTLKSA